MIASGKGIKLVLVNIPDSVFNIVIELADRREITPQQVLEELCLQEQFFEEKRAEGAKITIAYLGKGNITEPILPGHPDYKR